MTNYAIPELPVATVSQIGDLFIIRQGSVDKQITQALVLGSCLKSSNNLSDLENVSAAQTNLQVAPLSNTVLKSNNLSDVTASAARTNLGLAIGTNVQSWSAELDSLIANSSNIGILTQIGSNSVTSRSLMQPAAGLTITNANAVAGNPVFALANDLAALEGLSSTGIAARTGTDAWAQRSMAVGSSKLSITNADGSAGNPTYDAVESNFNISNMGGNLSSLSSMTGQIAISKGGTGQSTKQAAFDALSPNTTQGDITFYNGSHNVPLAASQYGLFQSQGASTNPIYIASGNVGGRAYLGYFAKNAGTSTFDISGVDTLISNLGIKSASLVIKVNNLNVQGPNPYPNSNFHLQLGFGASPTWVTTGTWLGNYTSYDYSYNPQQSITSASSCSPTAPSSYGDSNGIDLLSGITAGGIGNKPCFWNGEYYLSLFITYSGMTPTYYIGLNGTFAVVSYDSGLGTNLLNIGKISGFMFNGTNPLTALRILPSSYTNTNGFLVSPGDVSNTTTTMLGSNILLYADAYA